MAENLPRDFFPGNHTVFHFGTLGNCAYIIESGSVEILSQDGHQLATMAAGALFGEVALLDLQERTATVRTLEPTTLLRIEHDHVQEMLRRTDPVIRHLLNLLLTRFRNSNAAHFPHPQAQMAEDRNTALRKLTLTRDLSHALQHGQLTLYYQPLVECQSRRLIGFEALARWQHPTQGLIMPMEFIDLAEKTGLIHEVGLWALHRAIVDWGELRKHCPADSSLLPFVSVNLSAEELSDTSIADYILGELDANGISPRELKIELTETVIIEDRERVAAVLDRLTARGIAIALDDFGTGYAGLDYLKALPISTLKIDKAFVQEMSTSLRSYEIVQSALNLAASLGLTTVAEGIEDEETCARLTELGCDVAQGYYFAKPMPAASVAEWLRQSCADGRVKE